MKNWTLYILLGFLFFSCKTNDLLPFNTTQEIKIVKIDAAKFKYQIAFKFINKKRNIGFLLIDKKEKAVLEYLKSIKRNSTFIEICDVTSYRAYSNINFTGHATQGAIYENGELEIDLSNKAKNKYYTICYDQFQKIKNGL